MNEGSDRIDVNADVLGRVLAEASADFVCLANSHGEPFYLNPAGQRLVGLDEGQPASSINLRELYAEESWAELRDVAVPAVNKTGHWQGRSRLRNVANRRVRRRRREPVPAEIERRRPAHLPGLPASPHRRPGKPAARALAEAQARKRAILESSLDPIITINHEGVITEFNRAAEQTFGHPREKVLGSKPSDVLFPAAASAGEQDRIDRYLDVGEGSLLGRRVEVTAVRANGETFDAEMAMTISHEQGAPC